MTSPICEIFFLKKQAHGYKEQVGRGEESEKRANRSQGTNGQLQNKYDTRM